MTTVSDECVLQGLDHYRTLQADQQPVWPDAAKLAEVSKTLSTVAPLVVPAETETLTQRLAAAGRGLRRDLRGRACGPDPEQDQNDFADGSRADARRLDADRQDGPHGRAVREAALLE